MLPIISQRALHIRTIDREHTLRERDAQLGLEPGGHGAQVRGACGGVAGGCAVCVEFEVADLGREEGEVGAELGGEGVH